jgi:hypothetical protein
VPGSQWVPARTTKPWCFRAFIFAAGARTALSPKNEARVMDAMIPWCVSVKDEQEVADDGEDIIIIKNFWRIPVDQSENGSSLIICIG